MPNPKLIELAERQMNPNLPKEKPEKKESKLTQILERDSTGKPILHLIPLEKTAVNTPTPEDYDILMRVYECGRWLWWGKYLPTKLTCWNGNKEENCVGAENKFGCAYKTSYLDEGWKIISSQEFYDRQNITQERLNEINQWFKQNDK